MSAPAKTRMDPSEYDLAKLEVELMLLTKHYTPLPDRDIDFVVFHHTTIPGNGNGDVLVKCWQTWQNRQASAHYSVDGMYIAQHVWDKDFAWATGSNTGNLHGLSIEMANLRLAPSWEVAEQTWRTAAKLAAYMHVVYKLGRPIKNVTVRRHGSFIGTECPGPYINGIWDKVVAEVQRVYDLITKTPAPVKPPVTVPSAYTVKGGDTLWAIARKFDVTVEQLASWNNIPKPYVIRPGNVLLLETKVPPTKPPVKPKTQKVRILLLPTAGYNANNARGVRDWKRNTDGLAKLVLEIKPDVVGTTEMSNRSQNPMLPRFDDKVAKLFKRRAGGSDGRYIYKNVDTCKSVVDGSGHVNAAQTTLLNGDDKQAAWSVEKIGGTPFGFIVIHTENEDGVDKKSKKDADTLRVDQTFSMIDQAVSKIKKAHPDIEDEHIFVFGDFNSNNWVKDALVAKGWKAVGPGYFTRWDDSAKRTFDWGFIQAGTATSKRINHDFGDHTALLIEVTVPV